MGNSNSIPNSKQRFTLEELHSYYQQEGLNFNSSSDNRRSLRHNNDNHHDNQQIQSRLTDAYLHETYQDHHQQQQHQQSTSLPPIAHVKVLPDFNPDGARLRCTTNGNILNSGGTISGRKDQQHQQQQLDLPSTIEPFVQSFSSLSPKPPPSSSAQIIRNRSSAQLTAGAQIIRNKSFDQLHIKDINRRNCIQSTKIEPSINQRNIISNSVNNNNRNQQNENSLVQRNHYDNDRNNNSSNNNNNKLNLFSSSGKTNIVKCKKKKSAPLPPPITSRNNENIITNNRNHIINNNYDNKQLQKQQSNQNNNNQLVGQQRKLRLFKTNAETKKSLPLATSSSNNTTQYHPNNNLRGNNNNDHNHHTRLTGPIGGNDKNSKIGINNYKDARVKLFPTPIIFRREKSFDASLLLNHRKQYNDNNNNNSNNNDKIDLKHNYNQNNMKLQRDISVDSSKLLKNLQQQQPRGDYNHHNHEQRSPNIKKSHLETKINKITTQQPSSQIFKNNFKKELEEATKNRRNSISAIDLTSLNSLNYDIKDIPVKNLNKNDNKDLVNNNNRKISQNNDEKICTNNNLKKDNQNITESKKFYFGMGSNKKINENKDEQQQQQQQQHILDLHHEKLSGSSLSDIAIENRILSQQLIDKNPIDFMNEYDINHKNQNSLSSSESLDDDNILLNNDSLLSPQLYKIPKNCTHNNIDDDTGDIQLNVRPTLPRRQLEIPRFSPAAAWRMLNDEQKKLLKNLSNNCNKLNIINSSTETLSLPDLIKQQQQQQQQQPVLEERIQRIFREPPLIYSDNKSGDSGISGDDAGLQLDGGTDSPGINFVQDSQNNNSNRHQVLGPAVSSGGGQKCIGNFSIPWTPQQDLEDEDEDDEMSSLDCNNVGNILNDDVDGIRGHVFSVSLPREGHNQGTSYGDKEKFGFSSLQKLKRTVSGAFLAGGNCTSNTNTTQIINSNNLNSLQNNVQQTSPRLSNYCSDNWLLSCSALNSIENSQNSSTNNNNNNKENSQQHSKSKSSTYHDTNLTNSSAINKGNELLNEDDSNYKGSPITNTTTTSSKIQPSSLNYVTTGRHMMYLPNRIKDNNCNNDIQSSSVNNENNNKTNKKQLNNLPNNKSNNKKDNLKKEILRENLQDSMPLFKEKKSVVNNRSKNSSNHRFTFQSTVRQIERKRISERLSKEAEEKEALRKSELEAMTKVEEEFQRKRAREKATICHQLRLYSMEENQCTSLPIDFQETYNDESHEIKNDLSLQKLPIQKIRKNSKINKYNNNNNNRNFRAEPDGAVSNSPPPSPSYSQNNHHKYNHLNSNYYDDEYFNISDDTKGLQNSNQRQRKNSMNLNYFQKTSYLDELNIPNRSPIQRYNDNSDQIGRRHNIDYDSESDLSEKNDIRMKYRRHNGELR